MLISTGGTGGHLFPGISVAREWLELAEGRDVLLVGARRPLDRRILADAGLPYRLVPAGGVKGKSALKRIRSLCLLGLGFLVSLWIVVRFRPHVVLGGGGYASAPAVLAARCAGRPVVLMEQNARPGAANRFLARFAQSIALGFPEARASFPRNPCAETGNPLRPEIEALAAERQSGLISDEDTRMEAPGPLTLLVFGGSQGSRSLNKAVCGALPAWKDRGLNLRFLHATGPAELERVRRAYQEAGLDAEVFPFIEDMASVYRRASLALTRAGALTVTELMAVGLPAILVPLPSGTDQHQEANAASAGVAARTIREQDLPVRLVDEVEDLVRDAGARQSMSRAGLFKGRTGAAARIAHLCLKAARREGPHDRQSH